MSEKDKQIALLKREIKSLKSLNESYGQKLLFFNQLFETMDVRQAVLGKLESVADEWLKAQVEEADRQIELKSQQKVQGD